MTDDIRQVEFDEEAHVYTYRGKRLNGVTGIIGDLLGKHFPRGVSGVEVAASYGSQVHKAVERHFNDGTEPDGEAASYAVSVLEGQMREHGGNRVLCEQRVSDFTGTASNVDAVLYCPDGAVLYDIKTGAFDRTYCTLQLNAYRVLFEKSYGIPVKALYVIATRSRRTFRIVKGHDKEVGILLARNVTWKARS